MVVLLRSSQGVIFWIAFSLCEPKITQYVISYVLNNVAYEKEICQASFVMAKNSGTGGATSWMGM
jgi:hypothetical protein